MQTRTTNYIGLFFILVYLVYTPSYPDPSMAIKWFVIAVSGIALTVLMRKTLSGLSFVWLLLIGWLISQFPLALQAVNPVESLAMFWKYAGVVAAATALAAWWRNDPQEIPQLARWVNTGLVFLLVSALAPLLKFALAGTLSENLYLIQGLGGHKNMLSMLLFLSIGLMAYSARYDRHKLLRTVFLSTAFLALICTIVLRTRSLWIALIVAGSIVFAMLYLHGKKTNAALPKWIYPTVMAVPIILVVLFFTNVNDAGDATNLSHRVSFWQKSISMWSEHPQGVGPGMWKIHLPAQGLQGVNHAVEQGKTQLLRPHNDYLWTLTEGGWLGAIGYWGFLLLTTVFAFKYRPKEREALHFHLAALFGWLGYLIFSFFDFPLERPEHLLTMLFLAGYFHRNAPGFTLKKKMQPLFLGILVVLLVGSAYVGKHRLQGESELASVIEAHEKRNARQLLVAVDNALTPYFNMDRVANSLYYYRGLSYFAQKQLPQAHEAFTTGLELTPYNLPTLQQMADFYRMCHDNLNDQQRKALVQQLPDIVDHRDFLSRAEALYQQALSYSPHFSNALFNLAELSLRNNNHRDALEYLSQVYVPDHASPKFTQLTERAITLWASSPPNERKRPQLAAYFQTHDPEFKRIPKTYSNFLQSL